MALTLKMVGGPVEGFKTLGGPGSGNFGHAGGSGDGPGGSSGGGATSSSSPSVPVKYVEKAKGLSDTLLQYAAEYNKDGKPHYAKQAEEVSSLLTAAKYSEAVQRMQQGDLRYDIPNTATSLVDLKNDVYIATEFGEDWGKTSGTFTVWRSGDLKSPRGVFFSIDEKGAQAYAEHGGKADQYEVTIKNPYVSPRLEDAYSDLTGKDKSTVLAERDRAKDVNKWWQKVDKLNMDKAKQLGYDAITYTKPAPPALREMVVFDKGSIKASPKINSAFHQLGGPGSGNFGHAGGDGSGPGGSSGGGGGSSEGGAGPDFPGVSADKARIIEARLSKTIPKEQRITRITKGREPVLDKEGNPKKDADGSPVTKPVYEWRGPDGKPVGAADLERISNLERVMQANADTVVVSTDPTAVTQGLVHSYTATGKEQWQYARLAESKEASALVKHARIVEFDKTLPDIRSKVDALAEKGDAAAVAIRVVDQTCIRVGSKREGGSSGRTMYDEDGKVTGVEEIKTKGLTNLTRENVSVKGNTVHFEFDGKSAVHWNRSIEDPVVADFVKGRLKAAGDDEPIFNVTDNRINKTLSQAADGRKFTIKDFRTHHATETATDYLSKNYKGEELTYTRHRELVAKATEAAAQRINDRPATAKKEYIAPSVWDRLGPEPPRKAGRVKDNAEDLAVLVKPYIVGDKQTVPSPGRAELERTASALHDDLSLVLFVDSKGNVVEPEFVNEEDGDEDLKSNSFHVMGKTETAHSIMPKWLEEAEAGLQETEQQSHFK